MYIKPEELSKESLDLNSELKLFQIYKKLKNVSLKSDTYFHVYEELFSKYVGKEITFVEVGVLHGGSLYMWKEYFGKNTRIIGVDLNPSAKDLEKDGFEIFIGSQSDENFWRKFYAEVGKIDILLDDGGHENNQQIVTLSEAIPNINDEGLVVVEDTHTSYFKKFGNPSKYSFINYSKYMIDVVNSRFPSKEIKKNNDFRNRIYSISFYESIVAIKVNSKKSIETSFVKNNNNDRENVIDMRKNDYFPTISNFISNKYPKLNSIPIIKKIIRKIFYTNNFIVKIKNFFKIKKYFK